MKNKTDIFEKFKEWRTLIENQTRTKLKTLRTDDGMTFILELMSFAGNNKFKG